MRTHRIAAAALAALLAAGPAPAPSDPTHFVPADGGGPVMRWYVSRDYPPPPAPGGSPPRWRPSAGSSAPLST